MRQTKVAALRRGSSEVLQGTLTPVALVVAVELRVVREDDALATVELGSRGEAFEADARLRGLR